VRSFPTVCAGFGVVSFFFRLRIGQYAVAVFQPFVEQHLSSSTFEARIAAWVAAVDGVHCVSNKDSTVAKPFGKQYTPPESGHILAGHKKLTNLNNMPTGFIAEQTSTMMYGKSWFAAMVNNDS
jgi:hypothetical protein